MNFPSIFGKSEAQKEAERKKAEEERKKEEHQKKVEEAGWDSYNIMKEEMG